LNRDIYLDAREMNKIKDKDTITLKEASKLSGYSPDYIGQLIRQGKLPGKQIYSAVSWVTTEEAVLKYMDEAKTGAVEQHDTSQVFEMTPEFLGALYIYAGRVVIALLGVTLLALFFLFSVSADHYIMSRVESSRYAAQ
jgi:hypothetical protein